MRPGIMERLYWRTRAMCHSRVAPSITHRVLSLDRIHGPRVFASIYLCYPALPPAATVRSIGRPPTMLNLKPDSSSQPKTPDTTKPMEQGKPETHHSHSHPAREECRGAKHAKTRHKASAEK